MGLRHFIDAAKSPHVIFAWIAIVLFIRRGEEA
jgi:hypothetical protein